MGAVAVMPLIHMKEICQVHEMTRFNDEFHSCDNCGIVLVSEVVLS